MKCQICYLAPIFALAWRVASPAIFHWSDPTEYSSGARLPPLLYQPGLAPGPQLSEGRAPLTYLIFNIHCHYIRLHFTLNICQTHTYSLDKCISPWWMHSSFSGFLDYTLARYHDFYCLLPLTGRLLRTRGAHSLISWASIGQNRVTSSHCWIPIGWWRPGLLCADTVDTGDSCLTVLTTWCWHLLTWALSLCQHCQHPSLHISPYHGKGKQGSIPVSDNKQNNTDTHPWPDLTLNTSLNRFPSSRSPLSGVSVVSVVSNVRTLRVVMEFTCFTLLSSSRLLLIKTDLNIDWNECCMCWAVRAGLSRRDEDDTRH